MLPGRRYKYLPFAVQWSGANSDCPNLRFSRVFRFRLPRSLRQIESPEKETFLGPRRYISARPRPRHDASDVAPTSVTKGTRSRSMPPPVPALRLKLPPRPGDGTSRARHEGWRGDATESSRDRNVPDADGSWDTSSADTEPSFDFAPVFDAPERSERGEPGPPRDDAPRASRSASGGSASEPSDAVLPDDPGLLRAMRRPRLAASSVAAFLSQRDGLRAGAWETERAAETSDARADEASEAEGSGDDRPDDRSLGTERTSGSPRDDKKRRRASRGAC